MRVFLDFEASSLGKRSYPIEVGWAFEDGAGESHLIRPMMDWTDWDATSAAIHGITRAVLRAEGEAVEGVAARMLAVLAGHDLYASAPSWDGKWLSTLLRAAGRPRHALRLRDTEEVFTATARERLGGLADEAAIAGLVERARCAVELRPPVHRALADARREWKIAAEILRVGALVATGWGRR